MNKKWVTQVMQPYKLYKSCLKCLISQVCLSEPKWPRWCLIGQVYLNGPKVDLMSLNGLRWCLMGQVDLNEPKVSLGEPEWPNWV